MCNNVLKGKFSGLKLFIMVFLFSMVFLVTTVHAAVPYTYKQSATTGTTANTIDIKFDYNIELIDTKKITIYQTTASGGIIEKSPSTVLRALSIKPSTTTLLPKVLSIEIGTLDSDVVSYAIKIENGALKYPEGYIQLTDFILPFSSTDLSSGFKSIFMNPATATGKTDELNDIILKYNSPREISIYVPKKYITSIETIHKKNGLSVPKTTITTAPTTISTTTTTTVITPTTTDSNGTTTDISTTTTPTTTTITTTITPPSYTKLTNIDVKTDSAVKRLKVSVANSIVTLLDEKELFQNSTFTGFTTGQAGLDIDTTGSEYKIHIEAFDINGKLLEDSTYPEKVQDKEIISDYITSKTSTVSNKAVTLYDLLKTPATLTSMLQSFTTDTLDSIKVVYPNTLDTRVVSNSEGQTNDAANVLAKALSDGNVQYIKFLSALSITPTQMVTLAKPERTLATAGHIVLDGNGSTINGNVTIGRGGSDNNTYDLRNITINGDLTISVSSTGDCILSGVTINGDKIVTNKKSSEVTDVVSMDDKQLYGIGEIIKIGVKFSEPVFVVGNPVLRLNVGDAIYNKDLSTPNEIVFNYVVKQGDAASSITSSGIITNEGDIQGDIQALEGASHTSANTTKSASNVYSSISKTNIVVDGIRPSYASAVAVGSKITYTASELLDKDTTEVVGNWKIRNIDTTSEGFTDYSPLNVVLQGDNKTVIMEMSDSSLTIAINAGTAIVFMTSDVKDKAKNSGNDMVIKAEGSLGVAWHTSIVGLPTDYNYKVIVGTGDSAILQYVTEDGGLSSNISDLKPLKDTKLLGLTNGITYKVMVVVGAQPQDIVIVAADKARLTDSSILNMNSELSSVTTSLQLPLSEINGSAITWASSGLTSINIVDGVVTRPAYSAGNQTGTLTATIQKDTAIDTKIFAVTVLKKDFTVNQSTFADNNFKIVGDGYLPSEFGLAPQVAPSSLGSIGFTGGTTDTTWLIDGLTYTLSYVGTTGVATVTLSGTAGAASIATTKDITVTKDEKIRKLTLNIPIIVAGSTAAQVAVTVTVD